MHSRHSVCLVQSLSDHQRSGCPNGERLYPNGETLYPNGETLYQASNLKSLPKTVKHYKMDISKVFWQAIFAYILCVSIIAVSLYSLLQKTHQRNKNTHHLPHLLLSNNLIMMSILLYLALLPQPLYLAQYPKLYYTVGLLAPLQLFLLAMLDSFVLQTFCVLLPFLTSSRMHSYRLFLAIFFGVCVLPSILQYYYGFVLSDAVRDTPVWVQRLTGLGAAVFAVVVSLVDTVQSVYLVSIVRDWSLTTTWRKRIAVGSSAEEGRKRQISDLYKKSIDLTIVIALLDWAGIFIAVYVALGMTEEEKESGLNVVVQGYAIAVLCIHSFTLIYQYELLRSIALSHRGIELAAAAAKKEKELQKEKQGQQEAGKSLVDKCEPSLAIVDTLPATQIMDKAHSKTRLVYLP